MYETPAYRGAFYSKQQAAGDVIREIFAGLRTGRQDSQQAREQRRLEEERASERDFRTTQWNHQLERERVGDGRQAILDSLAQLRERIALEKEGVFAGKAPANITEPVDFSGIGGVGRSFIQNPNRYRQLDDGHYRDDAKTPETQARVLADTHRQTIERLVTRLHNGDQSAVGAAAAAGINPRDYDPAARPGTPQYLAAKRAENNITVDGQLRVVREELRGRRELASMKAEPTPGRPIPPKVVEDIVTNEAAIRQIDDAIAMLSGTAVDDTGASRDTRGARDAIGPVDGFKPTMFTGQAGQEFRSALANISSITFKNRSGQAVTASEEKRLADYIPNRVIDDEASALTKLRKMRAYILDETDGRREAYSPELGFREMPAQRLGATASPSSPTGTPNPFRR